MCIPQHKHHTLAAYSVPRHTGVSRRPCILLRVSLCVSGGVGLACFLGLMCVCVDRVELTVECVSSRVRSCRQNRADRVSDPVPSLARVSPCRQSRVETVTRFFGRRWRCSGCVTASPAPPYKWSRMMPPWTCAPRVSCPRPPTSDADDVRRATLTGDVRRWRRTG